MTDQTSAPIPADDPSRALTVVTPDDTSIPHLAQAGNIYTVLISGAQTGGRYCLFDMLVSPGGGPPSHRHDFEEMFTLIEGELEFTFRGEVQTVRAPASINVPANAPHRFFNRSDNVVRMLCMCAPAGLDELFLEIATPVPNRQAPPPPLDEAAEAAMMKHAMGLSAKYRVEVQMD